MEQHPVDIVVTDIRMPAMSGLELIERIRSKHPMVDCILLTGFADFQYARRALELHAVGYLLKPVRDEELIPMVRELVEQRKRKREEQRRMMELQADVLEARAEARTILETERKRMAHDLHDIVGHTLTTTLLQMEAAKLLILKNELAGLQRLEHSQRMVRESLESMREAVRMMREPDGAGDLEKELRQLLGDVVQAADLQVDYELDLPEPISDPLIRKALYHALQEGITNGLRHGAATEFRFRLVTAGGELVFLLWNNGIPYNGTAVGFGLQGMEERVRQAGGIMNIAASVEPKGTILTIQISLGTG